MNDQENSPLAIEAYSRTPEEEQVEVIQPTVIHAKAPAKSGFPFNLGIGNMNLSDLKTLVDRMGGIDGVLTTMGKLQKIVSSVQQMTPMIKLLFGKGTTSALPDPPPSRPRRRRRRPAAKRRKSRYYPPRRRKY